MSARRRVAVLKGGRSLERSVSLRSGAQVQDALTGLGHEVVAVDVGETFVADMLERGAEVAFVALHGREGEDGTVQGLLEALSVPYTGSGQAACMRATDKLLAKLPDARGRDPDAPIPRAAGGVDQGARRGGRGGADPQDIGLPLVVKPARGARPWGSSSPARRRRAAESHGRGASPTTARSCWNATSAAATWRCRCSTRPRRGFARRGAPGGRGGAPRGGVLRLRVPLRDRDDHLRVPGGAPAGDDRPRPGAGAAGPMSCSAATGSLAST